jgi:CRP-like cAMP-binding protein
LPPQGFLDPIYGNGSVAMNEQSAIDTAVKRLAQALDGLDAAVERRREADRGEAALAAQVQTLAANLDGETARSRRLETTNREIAERLDTAIATIQSVLDSNE